MKTKSALSWYGSDSRVSKGISEVFQGCKHMTIPFCGGLAILPHLHDKSILANDCYKAAINFYRVASGSLGPVKRSRLLAKAQNTLSHPSELSKAMSVGPDASAEHRAWALWAMCWLPRKGRGGATEKHSGVSVRRTESGAIMRQG